MSSLLFSVLVAGTIAALVCDLLVPVVTRVAHFLQALDHPGERKSQALAIPRLGGVAIVGGCAVAGVGVVMMQWGDKGPLAGRSELVALAIGALMVFLVGVVDDLVGASVAKKFLVEIAAAFLLVRSGWTFEVLYVPGVGNVELGVLGNVVAVVWIVGVTNAINLIDGLDGLAGGVVAIIASGLALSAILQGSVLTAILLGAIGGASVGFLRHNWAPATIFMGDSGSLTLGYLLGALSVYSSLKTPAAVAILVPILALGLPVMDTLVVMVVRFLGRRQSLPGRFLGMFRPDRQHLHHMLEGLFANRRRIVKLIYLAAALFCTMALLVATTHNAQLGLVLLGVQLLAVLVLRSLGRMSGGRQGSTFRLRPQAEVPAAAGKVSVQGGASSGP
ncbi:MAG: MraY family glycosyltransferase [Thermoanaerobaculia bacterium]